ncbi:hypothetical protein HN709_05235 [Candidatus Peregrinibacteria bacterium]|jgi:hypothetical protein|nr:hypothetical protein [Candidatus Peregrinibacteria bacterium]
MTKKIKFHHKVLTKGREIAIVFALILIISTFLPWGQTEVASVTGLKGDGQYVIGIGFLAFGLLFVKKFPKMIAYLLALALLALGAYYFIYRGMVLGAKPWVSLLFLADLIVIAILVLRRRAIFVSLALGINALALGLIDFHVMAKTVENLVGGEIGIGLYLALIASCGIVLGTIVEGCQEQDSKLKKKLFFFDQKD